jgi:hypothetical protein
MLTLRGPHPKGDWSDKPFAIGNTLNHGESSRHNSVNEYQPDDATA